jgi:hypothetical protein
VEGFEDGRVTQSNLEVLYNNPGQPIVFIRVAMLQEESNHILPLVDVRRQRQFVQLLVDLPDLSRCHVQFIHSFIRWMVS